MWVIGMAIWAHYLLFARRGDFTRDFCFEVIKRLKGLRSVFKSTGQRTGHSIEKISQIGIDRGLVPPNVAVFVCIIQIKGMNTS